MTDHEVKHSGVQNVGYIEREDGELILTSFDPGQPAWIVDGDEHPEYLEIIMRAREEAAEATGGILETDL